MIVRIYWENLYFGADFGYTLFSSETAAEFFLLNLQSRKFHCTQNRRTQSETAKEADGLPKRNWF